MAWQLTSSFGQELHANVEPQDRALPMRFSPQPDCPDHLTTAWSAASPGMAFLALGSSHVFPPQSSSLSVHMPDIEETLEVENQAAAGNIVVPALRQGDTYQPFATPVLGQHASASRRSKYSSLDWDTHLETIRRLYMDEERPLKETMEIMAEEHGFRASEKLYKEKFREWGWCKYLSAANAQWMLSKANARKVEKQKETVFVISGRVWTLESVEKRARRAGVQGGTGVHADAPTPMGVTYSTPRNAADYPSPAVVSRWTPAPESSLPANRYTMCLSWNGCTATEAMTRFRKAQESDQQGDTEGAERQFREALAAFEHLLSPTHENTRTAAYSLAAFYARCGHMQEANNVLDWMSERHVERWGVKSKPTIDHVLRVVNLLNSWLRPQDAHAFLEKAKDYLCQPEPQACGRGGQYLSIPPDNGNAAYQRGSTASSAFRTAPSHENPGSEIVVNPSSTVDCQLRSAEARVRANDELVEPLLLSLIAQCKQSPDNLAAQNLRARAALIELYRESARADAAVEELSKAQALFLETWKLVGKISRELIDASLEVAVQSLKSEQYNDADEMFQMIQERVCETFGPDHSRTMRLLIRIGLIYQNGNRWKDAEPRFEQALAASMAANGLEDALTRTLEEALENQHYSFIDSDPEDFITIIGSRGMRISPT